jgi:chemotaxis regulatin CheY-phosphate phosphatase CheZ
MRPQHALERFIEQVRGGVVGFDARTSLRVHARRQFCADGNQESAFKNMHENAILFSSAKEDLTDEVIKEFNKKPNG